MGENTIWKTAINNAKTIGNKELSEAAFLIEEFNQEATLDLKAKCLRKMLSDDFLLESRTRSRILRNIDDTGLEHLSHQIGVSKRALVDEDFRLSNGQNKKLQEIANGSLFNQNRRVTEEGLPTAIEASYSLFSHQMVIEDEIIKTATGDSRGCMVHMPTGTGKTRTAMSAICKLIATHKLRCCWITYQKTLTSQAIQEFMRAWRCRGDSTCRVAYFTGDTNTDMRGPNTGAMMIFASFGKLSMESQKEEAELAQHIARNADIVFIDEAHESQATGRAAALVTMRVFNPGIKFIGLSATPGRTSDSQDEKDLELAEMYEGRKVTLRFKGYPNPISYLIDNGYMANPTYRSINREWGNSKREDIEEIIEVIELTRDCISRHKRIMVFCSSVRVSKICASLLELCGNKAFHIDASTPSGTREDIAEKFRENGESPIALFNYNVLGTGFDAPNVSCVMICRVIKSTVLLSQVIGRGLRGLRAGGTKEVEIGIAIPEDDQQAVDVARMFMNWEHLWAETNHD